MIVRKSYTNYLSGLDIERIVIYKPSESAS